MEIVRLYGREKLSKLISSRVLDMKNTEIVAVSAILKEKHLPKDIPHKIMPFLIPDPVILNCYLKEGVNSEYVDLYHLQLQRPEAYWFINEIMYQFAACDTNIVLVASTDEEEYEYLQMICSFIEERYQVKPVSAKKLISGKGKTKCGNIQGLINKVERLRELLGNKLRDCGINPLELMVKLTITKKDIKTLPKKMKAAFKKIMKKKEFEE